LRWVCQKEDTRNPEETKEELIGSLFYQDWFHAHNAMSQSYHIEFVDHVDTIKIKQLLM